MNAADLARMAKQYANSLQAGGIDWIPKQGQILQSSLELHETPAAHTQEASGAAHARPLSATRSEPGLFELALDVLSTEQKRTQLQLIDEQEVKKCTKCMELVRNRTHTVFGVGNIDAELVFVGEAPGADEDKQGEPFVGAAGQLLNKIIAACKMKREEIYICNVLKCRPPSNRPPQTDEVSNCRHFLERQLSIIRPRFICCLGTHAAQTLLSTTIGIGKLRRQIHHYQGMKLVATYHPAYLLRNPNAKKDVWDDMKMMMAAMGRPVE